MIFRNILILGLIFIMSNNTHILAQQTWQIDTAQIRFTIRNAGLNVHGHFEGLEGNIQFDPDNLQNSTINAKIPVKTVHTGITARDRHLRQSDYFDVKKYPYITMKSLSFEPVDAQQFKGVFNLKIKNVVKKITLPFTFIKEGKSAKFVGEFEINRRDFGVGGWSLILGNETQIALKVQVK